MDAVSTDAGASKRTVYNHFPSKRELFKAVVAELYTGLLDSEPDALSADDPPEKALPRFARKALAHLRRPEVIGLLRLVVAEQRRFPELALDFHNEGKAPAIALLEGYLSAQDRRGRLKVSDPMLAAQQFLGGVKEALFWPMLLGLPVKREESQVIAAAVDALLTVYRVR
jgi:TetR/AcrR family transcriptional regulator of autoinduction and epiphytic fitness